MYEEIRTLNVQINTFSTQKATGFIGSFGSTFNSSSISLKIFQSHKTCFLIFTIYATELIWVGKDHVSSISYWVISVHNYSLKFKILC